MDEAKSGAADEQDGTGGESSQEQAERNPNHA